MSAWTDEPPLRDEGRCSPGTSGWHSWNCKSAELEFCEFAEKLVALFRPAVVIETGVGQGFTTRRVMKALPESSKLLAFESDDEWREKTREFFDNERFILGKEPTAADFAQAGVSILDSTVTARRREVELWRGFAQRGSLLLVHDVSLTQAAEHCRKFSGWLLSLGLNGILLGNPRGGFLAQHD